MRKSKRTNKLNSSGKPTISCLPSLNRNSNHHLLNYAGYTSLGLLCLLFIVTLLPIVDSSSYATDDASYGEMRTNINVAPVVSVAMQSKIDVDVTPKQNGSYAMATAKLTVATNSDNGYSVYIKSGNSATNSLVSTDNTNTKQIAATNVTTPLTAMLNNTWGYALSTGEITPSSNFSAVPKETSTAIATTNKDTVQLGSGNSYNLAFGVNIDTTLPAGQYTGSVIVSAVANPIAVTSLYQLTYMQDMTSDICSNTGLEVTKQLIDTRDGKSYWVAKLKDGNCWMTQNLALDIPAEGLSASDTDILQDWNESSKYPPIATSSVKSLNLGDDARAKDKPYSWNFGKMVAARPTVILASDYDILEWDGEPGVLVKELPDYYVDVANSTWMSTFSIQDGTYPLTDGSIYQGLVAVDLVNKTYDAHYLTGNYYEFITAVAGTMDVEATGYADQSICPKNWRLPTIGNGEHGTTNFNNTSGSFYYLLNSYGFMDTDSSGTVNKGQSSAVLAPLYLTRVGFIYPPNSRMTGMNRTGYLWGNFGATKGDILDFALYGNNMTTMDGPIGRYHAFNIRCLAR